LLERRWEELGKLVFVFILSVVAVSLFGFMDFIKPAQATPTIGTHTIIANYYQAYIYDDHDWIGAGEWYFGIGSPWEYWWTQEISRDGPGFCTFDLSWTWTHTGSLGTYGYYRVCAEEHDSPSVDYRSEYVVSVPSTSAVNTWIFHEVKVGDVNHNSRYYIYNYGPTVGSISGPSSGYRLLAYTFSATGSDPEGDSISYEWSVDGVAQPGTGASLTYTFGAGATLGTHTIRVRTKDHFGAYSSYATQTFTLLNQAPIAGSISDKYVTEGDSVSFSAPTVTDPEGDAITGYSWNFGDGATSTDTNPTHTYTEEGNYTVTFMAEDYFGAWSSNETAYAIVSPVFTAAWGADTYHIRTLSNSYPVKDFTFNQPLKQISFTVTGPEGTPGWCEVTLENEFLGGPYIVEVAGSVVTHSETYPDADHTMIRFEYTHSTKTVTITATTVVPEFPTAIILPLLMIATLVSAIIGKKIQSSKKKSQLIDTATNSP